jgi:hypothetical protein
MRSDVARGIVLALLPTLLFSAPALGEEFGAKEVSVNSASSATTSSLNPPANLNVEPAQPTQPTQPVDSADTPAPTDSAPVVAEQQPTPALLISTKVPTNSRVTPSTIAGAISALKLVEKAKTPKGARSVGKAMAKSKYGWGDRQYTCLNTLWTKESRWNYRSRNKVTGAHGIPQAYPATKYESIGSDWRTNPITQMSWGLKYIKVRYQTPCKALSTFYRINMY